MKDFGEKPRIRLGEINKRQACCEEKPARTDSRRTDAPSGPQDHAQACCVPKMDTSGCCASQDDKNVAQGGRASNVVRKVGPDWSLGDKLGAVRCRVSGLRNRYAITPGLYSIGSPGAKSNVFVSANYKLSFDHLRRALKGIDAWILVLDTKGINVWCAAGKGTFGTIELIRRIKEADLENIVEHRRVIVPQLGGPGIAAHEVGAKTGFRVMYGPVRAGDIAEYINNKYRATEKMRKVEFKFFDRLILTPMELIPALGYYWKFALLMIFVLGIRAGVFGSNGIASSDTLSLVWPYLVLGAGAVFAGAFVTPTLLPYVPFRAFAIKGWLTGFAFTAMLANHYNITYKAGLPLFVFTYLFFPVVSSYAALQFTGSTVYTGMSGVKKELKYATPVYLSALAVSVIMLAIHKIKEAGLL